MIFTVEKALFVGGCPYIIFSFLNVGLTSGHCQSSLHLRKLRLGLGETVLKADAVVTSVNWVHEADFFSFLSSSSKFLSKQFIPVCERHSELVPPVTLYAMNISLLAAGDGGCHFCHKFLAPDPKVGYKAEPLCAGSVSFLWSYDLLIWVTLTWYRIAIYWVSMLWWAAGWHFTNDVIPTSSTTIE